MQASTPQTPQSISPQQQQQHIYDPELRAALERVAAILHLPVERVLRIFMTGFTAEISADLDALTAAVGRAHESVQRTAEDAWKAVRGDE